MSNDLPCYPSTDGMTTRRLGAWMRPTIGKKLGLFILLFLAVTYASLHYAVGLFGNLDNSAHIVNETGRLRYLSQRIAFLATRLESHDRQELATQIEAYSRTLDAIERNLREEGRVLLAQTPELTVKIQGLRTQWQNYATAAGTVAFPGTAHEAAVPEALTYLHDAANDMLDDANDIVGMLTESDRRVRRQVHRQIDVAIGLEVAFLLLMFILIQRGISRPIRQLALMFQSFAAGDYSLRMKFNLLNSHDEVGDLARSFNRTAEITADLIRSLSLRNRQAMLLHRTGLALQEHTSQSIAPDVAAALDAVARLMPDGWQFPEIAAARIVCGDIVVQSPDFAETPWRLDAEAASAAGTPIHVTVCYLEARPTAAIGPFRAEEQELLDDLAAMLKTFVDGTDASLARIRLFSILENTTDLVATFQPDGRILYLNEAAQKLFGLGPAATDGDIAAHYPEWACAVHLHAALPAARRDGVWSGELAVLDAAGHEVPVSQILLAHHDAHGEIDFFSLVARDISENKRVAAQLERLANQDSLTGLPNRNLLTDRLAQALALARRQNGKVAVMFLDLDRFKTVNDSLGHDVGDRLLVVVGERLRSCLRDGDTVARIGGDEFVIVLPDIQAELDDLSQIESVAKKLIKSLAHPIQAGEQELFISASLGISLYPRDGDDAATLLKHADIAMYRAKEEGRNNHQFFDANMNLRAFERLSLENHLRRALENGEFVLHYQPQVEVASGRIVGMEALIRWQNPVLGLVPPAEFIPLAEETGLIVAIGEWVLRTACAQNKAWQDAGLPPVRVAVNLSARQFRQRDIVKMVADTLAATGLDGRYLDLELTESMLMHDPQRVNETLTELKNLDVRIALDDFGTGYSSLAYLKRFPIDEIKIDKSFVHDLADNTEDAAIVRAILGITRGLSLGSVAEGVETQEQHVYLRENDCERMQGYLFSRPATPEEIAVLLAAAKTDAAGAGPA